MLSCVFMAIQICLTVPSSPRATVVKVTTMRWWTWRKTRQQCMAHLSIHFPLDTLPLTPLVPRLHSPLPLESLTLPLRYDEQDVRQSVRDAESSAAGDGDSERRQEREEVGGVGMEEGEEGEVKSKHPQDQQQCLICMVGTRLPTSGMSHSTVTCYMCRTATGNLWSL